MDAIGNTTGITDPFSPMQPSVETVTLTVGQDKATGQFAPVQETNSMTTLNTEELEMMSKLFANLSNTIVETSRLRPEVNELRNELASIREEMVSYRQQNDRLDEEVNRLRMERDDLRDENTRLTKANEQLKFDLKRAEDAATYADSERTNWHNKYIQAVSDIETNKTDAENAHYKVLELEDQIKTLEAERDVFKVASESANTTLKDVRDRLNGTVAKITTVGPTNPPATLG